MITIFIPAYNEEEYLEKAVTNLVSAARIAGNVKLDVVIVDDASTDKTPQIIASLKKKYPFVRSIRHTANKGIGSGIREVIAIAKYPKFMIVPGDNDCSKILLTKLFHNQHRAEMVLSYYVNKEQRGRFRNFLSTIYGLLYMTTFDVYIQYFNGVGMYPIKRLRKINLNANGFSITAEINTKLLRSGCTLYEIPGFMLTGVEGSGSLTLKNFSEVVITYIRLICEIYWSNHRQFNHRPIRFYEDS